jgi:regulatory protein
LLITKLEKQKKAKNRWNIYVDGAFFCGLYEDTILKYGIHANEMLTGDRLDEIRDFDEYIYGKNVAYSFLSYRMRSVSEIKKKLREKKISGKSIVKVIELLEEQKLVDDREFAKVLIADKIKRNPVGRKVLKQKLFEKGVSKSVSDEALEKVFSGEEEKKLALEVFNKYLPKIKDKDFYGQKRKAFEHLARKGFDFDVINEVLNENFSKPLS